MKSKKVILIITVYFIALMAPYSVYAASWSPAKRLTWTPGNSEKPLLCIDSSGLIYLFWHDNSPGNQEIFFKKSTDSGATWSQIHRLTWNSGDTKNPSLVIDSNDHLHLFYDDDSSGNREIYFKKSTDSGENWSIPHRFTWHPKYSFMPFPIMGAGTNIYVFYSDNRSHNFELYMKSSTDLGASWSALQRITWNSGGSFKPRAACDSPGNLHLVWYDNSPGNSEIYYKQKPFSSPNWSAINRLSWNPGGSVSPLISIDDQDGLHIGWKDDSSGFWQVLYKRSTNGGSSWSPLHQLGDYESPAKYVFLVPETTDKIHAVYQDSYPGNFEIYYKMSLDNGATWPAGERLTWNSGASIFAYAALDPYGTLHIMWMDHTPGNDEIYYKKSL